MRSANAQNNISRKIIDSQLDNKKFREENKDICAACRKTFVRKYHECHFCNSKFHFHCTSKNLYRGLDNLFYCYKHKNHACRRNFELDIYSNSKFHLI